MAQIEILVTTNLLQLDRQIRLLAREKRRVWQPALSVKQGVLLKGLVVTNSAELVQTYLGLGD